MECLYFTVTVSCMCQQLNLNLKNSRKEEERTIEDPKAINLGRNDNKFFTFMLWHDKPKNVLPSLLLSISGRGSCFPLLLNTSVFCPELLRELIHTEHSPDCKGKESHTWMLHFTLTSRGYASLLCWTFSSSFPACFRKLALWRPDPEFKGRTWGICLLASGWKPCREGHTCWVWIYNEGFEF